MVTFDGYSYALWNNEGGRRESWSPSDLQAPGPRCARPSRSTWSLYDMSMEYRAPVSPACGP